MRYLLLYKVTVNNYISKNESYICSQALMGEDYEKDFSIISSTNKFVYLIYLLSNEYTSKNVILLRDVLEYTDTFFL